MYTQLLSRLGLAGLNPMQQAAAEAWRRNADIVLLSPTGTGKTLAYLLPLVATLTGEKPREATEKVGPAALIIVPGRELAQQSEGVMRQMKTPLRSLAVTGGRAAMEEHRSLKAVRPDVVFATPGRLLDHLQKGNIDGAAAKFVVMDEYDKCTELGFQKDIAAIFRLLPAGIRHIVTSATDSGDITRHLHPGFLKIDFRPARPEETASAKTRTFAVCSPRKDKLGTLGRLLSHIGDCQIIVFAAHRESVERIVQYLKKEKFPAEGYHGGMEQERRERALYKFRSGAVRTLVATDLAARGLDIPEVRAVVQYHLPENETTHTHRAGRTARWNATGDIYLIRSEEEKIPAFVSELGEIDVEATPLRPALPACAALYIGRGKRDKLSKGDIVGFLCKVGGLRAADIGRIEVHTAHAYVSVARTQLKNLLTRIAGEKIKGMKTLVEPMRG